MIRQDYVLGYTKDGKLYYPSMRDLSNKYGIGLSVIGEHAKNDEWVAQRKIYQNKKRTATEQKIIENYSNEASQFDIKCFAGARDIIELTGKNIQRLNASKEPLTLREIKELKYLTEIRLNAQKEAKLALGEVTENEQHQITFEIVDSNSND